MKNITRLSVAFAALAALSAAASAQAQEVAPQRLPLSFSRRPLTLTRNTLRLDAELAIAHTEVTLLGVTASSNSVGLGLGAGFGITEDLEVGATVIPLTLSPDFKYNAPSVYGTYRFLRGDVEVGARLALNSEAAWSSSEERPCLPPVPPDPSCCLVLVQLGPCRCGAPPPSSALVPCVDGPPSWRCLRVLAGRSWSCSLWAWTCPPGPAARSSAMVSTCRRSG